MTAHDPAGRVSLEALLAHRDWVRALARSLVADPHRADDVEQETWRQVLERPPLHAGSLRAWFGTVVRNAARKDARERACRTRHETAALGRRETGGPAEVIAEAEVNARLVRAVLDLGEPYSSTVLWRFFHGLGPGEIAARAGVPVETVKTRLKRALARLRERMRDDRDAWCIVLLGVRRWGAARSAPAAPLAAAAGGLAMAGATKAAVGAAAVLVALGLWSLARPGARAAAPGPCVSSAAPRPAAERRHGAAAEAARAPDADAAPPPEASSVLVVEVASIRGVPIAGAVVEVRRIPAATLGPPPRERESPDAQCATDATGTARLPGLRAGEWGVTAKADGFAEAGTTTFVFAQRPARAITLRLDRGFELRGTVRDVAGAPVPGAVVTESFRRFVVADASGAFVLGGLSAAEHQVHCGWTRQRMAPFGVRIAVPDVRTLDLVVWEYPTVTVTGTVVDDTSSAPIEGAVVRSRVDASLEPLSCVTDAGGRFRIERLYPSQLGALIAIKDGYLSIPVHHDTRPRTAKSADGVEVEDLRLGRGATVEGTVSTPEGPLADAEVLLTEEGSAAAPIRRSVRTDAAGAFAFACTASGRFHVSARAVGFIAQEGNARSAIVVPESGTVRVPPVVLVRGAVVEGVVLDAEGAPVAGAIVDWTRQYSDAEGRFRLVGKVPAAGTQIVAFAPGFADGSATVDVGAGTTTGVVIRLARTATIRGRLVARDGRAIADARVFVVAAQTRERRDPSRRMGDERGPFAVLEDGSFEAPVPESAANAFSVLAWTTSHAPARTDPVSLVRGQTEYRVEVALDPGATLRGRVTAEGRPAAGASIALGFAGFGFTTPPVRAVADADGTFAIGHVVLPRGGRAHATASLHGFADAEADLTADAPAELVLERPVELAGVAEGADGRPATGVALAVHVLELAEGAPDTQVGFAFTDEGGRFRVEGLRPGRYRLVARRSGASAPHEWVVTAGAPGLRLVLE